MEATANPIAALNAACAAVVQFQETSERERDALQKECDLWQHRCKESQAESVRLRARIDQLNKQADHLHEQILGLHSDFNLPSLPNLILEISMKLTHAEQGLLTDATGTSVVASIGLEEMTHVPTQALFEYTKQAVQTGQPVVINESVALPDGPQLVNIAVVPVAVRGDLTGVVMVANKRAAPFEDADTEILLSVGRHAGVALENQRLQAELDGAYHQTVAVLADAIMAKDAYTRGHCDEVSGLAVRVAERMGFDVKALREIRFAALLHDVGKIGISDGILLKPGRLLPEERSIIEKHAQIGSDLIARVDALQPLIPYIRHHHERVDGTGYPDGLTGDAIPLAARIIGAVDALDAMTSPRPYRDPVSRTDALAELSRCAGAQFDARVVSVVTQLLGEPEMASETAKEAA